MQRQRKIFSWGAARIVITPNDEFYRQQRDNSRQRHRQCRFEHNASRHASSRKSTRVKRSTANRQSFKTGIPPAATSSNDHQSPRRTWSPSNMKSWPNTGVFWPFAGSTIEGKEQARLHTRDLTLSITSLNHELSDKTHRHTNHNFAQRQLGSLGREQFNLFWNRGNRRHHCEGDY